MNELRRGGNSACTIIKNIAERVANNASSPRASVVTHTLSQLDRISDIISKPSKYESIVACLHPCLSADSKLEQAKFSCICGSNCSRCGFRQLWSKDLRPLLLDQNDVMIAGSILAGTEWNDDSISWRHCTQTTTITSSTRCLYG